MPDHNYHSITGRDLNLDLGDLVPPADAGPWSDCLKFSAASNVRVNAGLIQGGLEDCVDINNGCRGITVTADVYRSGGPYVATIKGNSHDIELAGMITRRGAAVDVDIDNYSDQSHARSGNIRLNLRTSDGSPVAWRSWRGVRPVILNPDRPYRCLFCLPAWLGCLLNGGYQVIKELRLVR